MQAGCFKLIPTKTSRVFKWDTAHLIFKQQSCFYISFFDLLNTMLYVLLQRKISIGNIGD